MSADRAPEQAQGMPNSATRADLSLNGAAGVQVGSANVQVNNFGPSFFWEKKEGDDAVARHVVIFLEDRRLLFGKRHFEDEEHCIRSAIDIRRFLSGQLAGVEPGGSLDRAIRAVRAAMRAFVDAAGPDAVNFRFRGGPGTDLFSLALGELRSRVGLQLALIAGQYGIEVEDDLAQILPPPIE